MKKTPLSLGILGVLLFSMQAKAGGYQLNEYTVTGLGRAYAGVGVVGDDYSAIAFNPAGMSLMTSGYQVGLTTVQLKANVDDQVNHKDPGTIRVYAPVPNIFAQYNVNDKINLGFGIYAPFGLSTRYKKDWFANATAVESQLEIVDFAQAISYKASSEWTLGASFILRYIRGKMTNVMPDPVTKVAVDGSWSEFDLDGWTVSGTLGVLYEPKKDTRLGFSWRLKSAQQVKGDHTISHYDLSSASWATVPSLAPLAQDWSEESTGRASPDLPETFTLSAYHKIDKVALSGTVKWTRWSHSFEKFSLESDSQFFQLALDGAKVQHYKWKDSWTITVGADYDYSEKWTFRAGTGYDESPSHSKYNRTIRIPDNDRIWLSVGFSYKMESSQVDVGYAHMFMKATEVDDEGVKAKYDSQSNILGVSYQYKF